MRRLLLLACVLLWAQQALAAHAIEHACEGEATVCLECLALPGMHAVPARGVRPCVPHALVAGAPRAVPPAPTFDACPAFRSRAPPLFQSR